MTEPTAQWQSVEGEVCCLTLTLRATCDSCGQAIPVNGPLEEGFCDNCQETSPLLAVPEQLGACAEGYNIIGSGYKHQSHLGGDPQCNQCGAEVPIGEYKGRYGLTTIIPCSSCEAGLHTYPAPPWLVQEFSMALQIFGGERPVTDLPGQAIDVDTNKPKPIAMNCPSCGGALGITADMPRAVDCTYCASSVFLPAELWKMLHPAKVMRKWMITSVGPLKTRKQLEEDAQKLRKQQQRAQALMDNQLRSEAHEYEQIRRDRNTTTKVWVFVAFGLAAIGACLYFLGS